MDDLTPDSVRRIVARTIYRLSHRIDRIGWWVAEHPCDRRQRKQAKAAALAEEAARIDGSTLDDPT